jgi:hypothetical protein
MSDDVRNGIKLGFLLYLGLHIIPFLLGAGGLLLIGFLLAAMR